MKSKISIPLDLDQTRSKLEKFRSTSKRGMRIPDGHGFLGRRDLSLCLITSFFLARLQVTHLILLPRVVQTTSKTCPSLILPTYQVSFLAWVPKPDSRL